MQTKRIKIPFISLIFLLSMCLSAYAATNWGTKGVSDTSRVTNIVQLTTTQATGGSAYMGYPTSYHPQSWRKDGKWVAFSSQVDGTNSSDWEICKIMPDGSSFTRLTNNSVNDTNSSFSADGKIYYNVNTDSSVLPTWTDQNWRMNEDGTMQTNLTPGANDENSLMVSPDGSMIAYTTNTGVLMVANADGTSPIQVSGTYTGPTNIYVRTGEYSWSPDSMWVAYSGSDATGYWIYKVRATGADHTQLTNQGNDVGTSFYHYTPLWSPDGSVIVYNSQVYNNPTSTYQLRTIDTNGTALKTLDAAVNNANPGWTNIRNGASWSPNSQWVAYTKYYYSSADTTYYTSIFIVNVKDTVPAPVQLTTGFYDNYPIWSPNGSQILFQSSTYSLSREDDTCSPSCTDTGDILILNLTDNYGSLAPFPWTMFLPSITNSGN